MKRHATPEPMFPREALIDEGTKNLGPFYANSADEAAFFSVVATQRFFMFNPKIGEDEPNLTSIFFRWVETTSSCCFGNVEGDSDMEPSGLPGFPRYPPEN